MSARAHVCMRMYVCAYLRVCACARVLGEREREVYAPASVPREAALSVSFIFITTDTLQMRACVCVLAVGQALETPCSSYKFMHFLT